MIIGSNDSLVHKDDYKYLHEVLPKGYEKKVVADYNHLDNLWGADQDKLEFGDIYDFFLKNNL